MERGALVPDELMVDLVSEALARLQANKLAPHLLLDGFPRTLAQAKTLDQKIPVDMVLSLDVPRATIVERLTDRCQRSKSVHAHCCTDDSVGRTILMLVIMAVPII